jgi:hypothetical protein
MILFPHFIYKNSWVIQFSNFLMQPFHEATLVLPMDPSEETNWLEIKGGSKIMGELRPFPRNREQGNQNFSDLSSSVAPCRALPIQPVTTLFEGSRLTQSRSEAISKRQGPSTRTKPSEAFVKNFTFLPSRFKFSIDWYIYMMSLRRLR